MFAKEDEAETLEIVLTDRVSGLKAHLLYGVFPHLDVITRAVRLENTGTAPVTVKKAMSMKWTMNTEAGCSPLLWQTQYGTPDGENSSWPWQLVCGKYPWHLSHHHNPFVILCDRNTEETYGNCYGYALAYSETSYLKQKWTR